MVLNIAIGFPEGSLEVKVPTRWTDGAEMGKVREEKGRRKKIQVQKIQFCENAQKSRITVPFQCFVAPEGRKIRQSSGPEPSEEMRDEKKLHKTPQSGSTFGC